MKIGPRLPVVIPSLDPGAALPELVGGLLRGGAGEVVVVDDGSTSPASRQFLDGAAALPGCRLLRHPRNLGKGAALKSAWRSCRERGAAGIVTADDDGQHTVKDILRVRAALAAEPGALVLGCRDFSLPSVPWRSRFGNRLTSRLLRLLAGVGTRDTQTGLRGIPARLADAMLELPGDGFELETEMLLEAARIPLPIVEVTIETVYIAGNSGTHFHPLRDAFRISRAILGQLSRRGRR